MLRESSKNVYLNDWDSTDDESPDSSVHPMIQKLTPKCPESSSPTSSGNASGSSQSQILVEVQNDKAAQTAVQNADAERRHHVDQLRKIGKEQKNSQNTGEVVVGRKLLRSTTSDQPDDGHKSTSVRANYSLLKCLRPSMSEPANYYLVKQDEKGRIIKEVKEFDRPPRVDCPEPGRIDFQEMPRQIELESNKRTEVPNTRPIRLWPDPGPSDRHFIPIQNAEEVQSTSENPESEQEVTDGQIIDVVENEPSTSNLPIIQEPTPSVIRKKSPKRISEKRLHVHKESYKKRAKLFQGQDFPNKHQEVIIVDEYDNNTSEDASEVRVVESPRQKVDRKKTTVRISSTPILISADAQKRQLDLAVPGTSNNYEEKYQELNRTLLKLLECPVCFEYMQPPIQNCKRGHLVCKFCRLRLESCPYCRSRLCETRNLAMEQVAESILYPCEFHSVGCPKQILLKNKMEHENNCKFKIYNCVFEVCKWKGQLKEYEQHTEDIHSKKILHGSHHRLVLNCLESYSSNWVINTFGEVFHLNMSCKNHDFTICVRHIGVHELANRYVYSIVLSQTCEDKTLREIRFKRNVHHYNEKVSSLNNAGETFFLKAVTAKLFMLNGLIHCSLDVIKLLQSP